MKTRTPIFLLCIFAQISFLTASLAGFTEAAGETRRSGRDMFIDVTQMLDGQQSQLCTNDGFPILEHTDSVVCEWLISGQGSFWKAIESLMYFIRWQADLEEVPLGEPAKEGASVDEEFWAAIGWAKDQGELICDEPPGSIYYLDSAPCYLFNYHINQIVWNYWNVLRLLRLSAGEDAIAAPLPEAATG